VSTDENNSAYQTAHLLIEETNMRHTTRLSVAALTLSLVACMPTEHRAHGDDVDDDCEKLEAEVTIRTMADFDELPSGCWDLWGALKISGSEITSLAPLNKLVGVNELHLVGTKLTTLDAEMPLKVYGPITIANNSQLQNLANMSVEAADDLTITVTVDDNALLASIEGLADLTRIDGDLTITNNPKLAAVELGQLKQVTGVTRISNNATVKTIGFVKLTVATRIEVTNNPALTTFGGFAAQSIKDMLIRGNKALTTLGTMTQLDRIEGGLTIDDNDALTSIGMFSTAAQYLTGSLVVSNNANLSDLGRISHLLGIGSANFNSNPKLSSCKTVEVQACVRTLGSFSAVANLPQSNCPANWCAQ
jgi:hypothetical protein